MVEDNLKEKLSSLIDGELEPLDSLRLFERIGKDSELNKQWARYSKISEAMRSGQVLFPDTGFVDRVSAALEAEPTILAPQARKPRTRERFVTAALAASLALVAVMVGKSLNDHSPLTESNLLAVADQTGAAGRAEMDPQFRDYLVSHYETAYLSGAQGMLPSIRLASTGPTH